MGHLYWIMGNHGQPLYACHSQQEAEEAVTTWHNSGHTAVAWKKIRLVDVTITDGNAVYEQMTGYELSSALYWLRQLVGQMPPCLMANLTKTEQRIAAYNIRNAADRRNEILVFLDSGLWSM